MATKDVIRRVRLSPYRKGCGPTFALTVWDCHAYHDSGPQWKLGYRLTIRKPGASRAVTLFEAEDYGCSPLHAIDSDAAIAGLLSFLTLRPGDTDEDYFADYTDAQRAYCDQHAEALSCAAFDRFGEE